VAAVEAAALLVSGTRAAIVFKKLRSRIKRRHLVFGGAVAAAAASAGYLSADQAETVTTFIQFILPFIAL